MISRYLTIRGFGGVDLLVKYLQQLWMPKPGVLTLQYIIPEIKTNTANAVSYICQKEKLQVNKAEKNGARGKEQYCQLAKRMMKF